MTKTADSTQIAATTAIRITQRPLLLSFGSSSSPFAAATAALPRLVRLDDNRRSGRSAQDLAELGQYVVRHLAARGLNGWADLLQSLVEDRADLLESVMSNASALLLGRACHRSNPFCSLMRVWETLLDRLLGVRRHPVDCLVRQRGDAIRG